jgi:hypothetical protein
MLDYRDKVRTELMRIELDDRHDIEGNTLYRLNFDSAVLPGEHTQESAVILVTVTPDEKANNTTENQDTLFKEWAIEMQTLVNKLITDKAKAFTEPNSSIRADFEFPREDQIAFDGFLRKNICDQVVKLSQKLEVVKLKLDETQAIDVKWHNLCPEPKASDMSIVSQNVSSPIVYYDCDKHPDSFFCEVEKLIGQYSKAYELVNYRYEVNKYLERLKKEKLISKASYKDAIELGDKIANDCSVVVQNDPNNPTPKGVPYNALWEIDKLLVKSKNIDKLKVKPKNIELKTLSDEEKAAKEAAKVAYPCFQNPPQTHRLVLAMGLLARLNSLSTIEPQKLYNLINSNKHSDLDSIENYPKVIEELVRPYICEDPHKQKVSEKSSLFSFPPAESYKYLVDCYTKKYTEQCMSKEYPNNGINQKIDNIKQLMASYQATRLNKLEDYFTATLQGCDMQSCGLALNAKPDAKRKLIEALDNVTQSFSYAVTPQVQAQRIAILNKQKEQLNIRINAALLAGSNKADSLINQLSSVEKELETLERHPLVIGFGDWKDDKKASINKKVTRRVTELDNIISNLEKLDETTSQDNADNSIELTQLVSLIDKELKILESDTLRINVGRLKIPKSINEVSQLITKRKEELKNKKNQLSKLQAITEDSVDIVPYSNYNSNELIASLTALKDDLQSLPNIETHFGWIIQPRLTESTTSPEKIEYRQIPGHYALSAIISIPSWWRTLKVQVNKCWLSNPTLGTSKSSLCDQKDIPPAFSIKVPGNAHDINQKLGFEVLKTPYIVIDDDPNKGTGGQELEVGRKGVVLLSGERLWRSTVIMVGSQKADSIEVLPDMKAVMATFKCVNPAAGDKVSAYKDATQAAGNVLFDNADLFFQGNIEALKPLLKPPGNNQTNPNDPPSNMEANPENCKNASQQGEGNSKQDCNGSPAFIKLWTSEGNTNNADIPLTLKPFVQRFPTDKPCYEFEENKQARKSDDS